MTQEQIRRQGLDALARELGAVGMIRFLQQFGSGQGDYTRDRDQWLDAPDVQTLAQDIIQHRSQKTDDQP
mgnify:CR=1 FL=1